MGRLHVACCALLVAVMSLQVCAAGRRQLQGGWELPGKRTELPAREWTKLYSSGLPRHAASPTPRITGGKETVMGMYPYMAALAFDSWFAECGGVLVHPRIILTAAHCVDPYDVYHGSPPVNTAHIGAWNLMLQAPQEESIHVQNILPHPLYNRSTLQHDVAALVLEWPSTITPVKMANGTEDLERTSGHSDGDDQWLVAMGWGITDPVTYAVSDTLRHVDLSFVPRDQCSSKYSAFDVDIDDTMLCALKSQGKDTCAGDSGGPLVMYGPGQGPEDHVLVGLVSFGSPEGCGHKTIPGVYSSVAAARDFVDSVAQIVS